MRKIKLFEHINPVYWILLLPLVDQTVSWVHSRMRGFVPFVFIVVWCLLVPKVSRFRFPLRFRFQRTFNLAFIFAGLCYFLKSLFFLFGHGHLTQYYVFADLIGNLIYLYVLYLTIKCGRFRELKWMTLAILAGMIVFGISSVRGLSMGIEGARSLAQASYAVEHGETIGEDAFTMAKLGLGGYATIHVCAALTGALLFAVVRIKDMRIRLLVALALIGNIAAVRGSGLGTPVFAMAFSLLLGLGSLVLGNRKIINVFSCLGIILFLFFVAEPRIYRPFSFIFSAIAEKMEPGGSLQMRIASVADALSGNLDAYANQRYALQRQSFRTFCKYPFFGCGAYNWPHPKAALVGGHSYFFDKLGQEGFVGFVFYICFLVFVYRSYVACQYAGLGRKWLPMPLIYIWSFLFISIANPVPVFAGYCFILFPGLALFFDDSLYGRRRPIQLPPNPRRMW